jgi:putative tricarboxylic transport membrane protein
VHALTSLRRNLIGSVILLLVAAGYFIAANRIGSTALSDSVGADGLPRIYGISLAALALAIGAGALIRRRLAAAASAVSETPGTLHRLMRAAITVVAGAAYLAVVDVIGYPFAIAVLVAAMAVYQGERFSWRVLLIAALGGIALYVLFSFVLDVDVPAPWND